MEICRVGLLSSCCSCYSSWTEVQNKSIKRRSTQTAAGRLLQIPGKLLWMCLTCIFFITFTSSYFSFSSNEDATLTFTPVKLFLFNINNYSLQQELRESVQHPRWMPLLLYYGEIPIFSCSLGLNSALQSRAVSTGVNEMALSQITTQSTKKGIFRDGEKASYIHLKQSFNT